MSSPCKKCGGNERHVSGRCALCARVYANERYASNKEKLCTVSAKYRKDHPEKHALSKARWNKNNRDKVRASANRRNALHPEKSRARVAKWQKENPDRVNVLQAKYRKQYKEKDCARVNKRNALKLHATPAWANDFIIKEVYHLAKLRSQGLGFRWHVDHIVPLRSKIVCGLHCEENLQVIPATLNRRKSNRYWPDMPGT